MPKHNMGKGGPGNIEQLTNALLQEAGVDTSGKDDVIDKTAKEMTSQVAGQEETTTTQQDTTATQTDTATQQDTEQADEVTELEQQRKQSIPQQEQEEIKAENKFVKKIDTARQRGFTDTEILDKIEKDRPELSNIIQNTREQTNDREALNKISEEIANERPSVESVPAEDQEQEQEENQFLSGVVSGVTDAFSRAGEKIQETGRRFTKTITGEAEEGEVTPMGEAGLQTIGATAGAVSDSIGTVVGETIDEIAETETGQEIGEAGKELLKTELGRKATKAIQEGGQRLQEFNRENPRLARNLGSALNIAELGADVAGGSLVSKGAKGVGERTALEVGEQAGKAAKKTVQATRGARKKFGEIAQEQAAGVAEKTLRLTPTDIKKVKKQSGIGEFLEGESPSEFLLRKDITGEKEDVMNQLRTFTKENRQKADELIQASNKSIQDKQIVNTAKSALKTLKSEYSQFDGPEVEEITRSFDNLLEKEDWNLMDLQKAKREIQRSGDIFTAKGETKTGKEVLSKQESKIRNFLEDNVEGDLQSVNKDTQVAQTIKEGLEQPTAREMKNRAISLTDNLWIAGAVSGGAAGGPPGGVAGALAGIVGKRLLENPKARMLFAEKLNKLGEKQVKAVEGALDAGVDTKEAREALEKAREETLEDIKNLTGGASELGISQEESEQILEQEEQSQTEQ